MLDPGQASSSLVPSHIALFKAAEKRLDLFAISLPCVAFNHQFLPFGPDLVVHPFFAKAGHERQAGKLALFGYEFFAKASEPGWSSFPREGSTSISPLSLFNMTLLFSRSGHAKAICAFPLLPQKTDLGIYRGEDEPELNERISQLVGQNIAALEALARKLFLRFGKSFTNVE